MSYVIVWLGAMLLGLILGIVLQHSLKARTVKIYNPDFEDSPKEQRGSNGVLYLHGRSGPLLVPADADPNDPCCQVPPEDLDLPEHSVVKQYSSKVEKK